MMTEFCRYCGMLLPESRSCSCPQSTLAVFDALRPGTSALEEVARAARGYAADLVPSVDRSILDAMKGLPRDYMSRVELAKLAGSMLEPGILEKMNGITEWSRVLGAEAGSIAKASELAGSMLAKDAAEYSRLLDSTKGLYEAIKPTEIDTSYSRLVEHHLQATRELQLRGSAIAELVESANRRHADTWTLIQDAIDSVPQVPDFRWLYESSAFDTIEEQMRSLREVWDLESQVALRGFDNLVGSIADVAKVLGSSRITAIDGRLAVDGFEINRSDLEQFLAGEEEFQGLSIEKLPGFVAQQRDPKKRAWYLAMLLALFKSVLMPFLIGIASSKVERAWSEGGSQAKATARTLRMAVEQRASQAVEKGIPPELLARYRIVTTSSLVVRSRPTKDSQRLGSLHVGDVVLHISTTKRSWALVEWSPDSDDVRARGWVFARYLAKLRLPSSTATRPSEDPEQSLEMAACH
jgi:hypothetical protein